MERIDESLQESSDSNHNTTPLARSNDNITNFTSNNLSNSHCQHSETFKFIEKFGFTLHTGTETLKLNVYSVDDKFEEKE
jgi:hypothetical protein